MYIRYFIPNKNGKIELTKEELQEIVDEAYREGSLHKMFDAVMAPKGEALIASKGEKNRKEKIMN